jgi:hypothetical protein
VGQYCIDGHLRGLWIVIIITNNNGKNKLLLRVLGCQVLLETSYMK